MGSSPTLIPALGKTKLKRKSKVIRKDFTTLL